MGRSGLFDLLEKGGSLSSGLSRGDLISGVNVTPKYGLKHALRCAFGVTWIHG